MEDIVEAVSALLFGEAGANVFAVLDGASVPSLRQSLFRLEPDHECLYRGELKPDMAEVAPYLVRLEPDTEFTDWVISQGWGNHWGIFAVSAADLRAMRQHFRRFLTVHDEQGKPLLFRYYDPRVLRVYLPACNAEELSAIFGPAVCYWMEGEDPKTALKFRVSDGALREEKQELKVD